MATKPGVNVEDLDNNLRSFTKRYRGHTYTMSELPYIEYQRTVKQATSKVLKDGEETEVYDGDAHNAIIINKSVKRDGKKFTADQLFEEGGALVRQILADLRDLNFEEEKLEDEEPQDDGEGEGSAPPSTSATGS